MSCCERLVIIIVLFYWDKKRSLALLHLAGLQLPGNLPQDGFVHSIRDPGSSVKDKMDDVTDSLQFKQGVLSVS